MAITVPGSIASNDATLVRDNAPNAAESTTLSDANFLPANAVDCAGWKRVVIFAIFPDGTAPTVTIQPLIRCGSQWVALASTAAIAGQVGAIVETDGRKMFFRVSAVTGAPTNVDIYCAGYEPVRFTR